VFAAELSRLCGPKVGTGVREAVSGRLRAWYGCPFELHRECALGAMLATGSDAFADIVIPLLSSEDDQVRGTAYGAGHLHLSSLGADWRGVVDGWCEAARKSFVGEIGRHLWMADVAESFARTDPSAAVRSEAIQSLGWIGASETLVRILSPLDDAAFAPAILTLYPEEIPAALRPRAAAVWRKVAGASANPIDSLRYLLGAAKLGGAGVTPDLKAAVDRIGPGRIEPHAGVTVQETMNAVRATDPDWVSCWVVSRILDNSLWGDEWLVFVSTLPEEMKADLFNRIAQQEMEHFGAVKISDVLARVADEGLARGAFARMFELYPQHEDGSMTERHGVANILGQLADFVRKLRQRSGTLGFLRERSEQLNGNEFSVALEVFGQREAAPPEQQHSSTDRLWVKLLREYLRSGVEFTLSADDPSGELKVKLAWALARIGRREDMDILLRLCRADIEQRKRSRQDWSGWHVAAMVRLDPTGAPAVLMDLLREPEYETAASRILVGLVIPGWESRGFGLRNRKYEDIWNARARPEPESSSEEERQRYATAIKEHIAQLRKGDIEQVQVKMRLKSLATLVAVLDPKASADLVRDIIELPGVPGSDGWTRVGALRALVFGGAVLTTDAMLRLSDPILKDGGRRMYDRDYSRLLMDCLSMFAFAEDPEVGVQRIRASLARITYWPHEVRDLITALGQSRSEHAVPLLVQVAHEHRDSIDQMMDVWTDALAALDTADSRRTLVGLAVAGFGPVELPIRLEFATADRLAAHIAAIVRADEAVKERVFAECKGNPLAGQREVLGKVVARVGSLEAVFTGLQLLDDGTSVPMA
jgi:hypothetical protein